MKTYIDLHIHTHYSDGTKSVPELLKLTRKNNVAIISFTDHDTVQAYCDFPGLAHHKNPSVIPGVELSVHHAAYGELHILGYCFDTRDNRLSERLKKFQHERRERGRKILEKVNLELIKAGREPIDFNLVKQKCKGTLGRPHIAQALVEKKITENIHTAFKSYLVRLDEPKFYFKCREAVSMISGAGGAAVLAHPGRLLSSDIDFDRFLIELKEAGIQGLEAYHPSHSEEQINILLEKSRKMDFFIAGGSDYHGLSSASSAEYPLIFPAASARRDWPVSCLSALKPGYEYAQIGHANANIPRKTADSTTQHTIQHKQ